MKLQDMKISKQLKLWMGIILVFACLLGALSLYSFEHLWQYTERMYEHSLTVRRAIGEIEASLLTIQWEMGQLVSEPDTARREQLIREIKVQEANIVKHLETIRISEHLGPLREFENLEKELVQWNAIRYETVRLLNEGKVMEAQNRTRLAGIEGAQAHKVLGYLRTISNIAVIEGDQYYQEAAWQQKRSSQQLLILLVLTILVSMGISYVIGRGVLKPLKELTAVTDDFRAGKLDSRSSYSAANEFGLLAGTFNSMAESVQNSLQLRDSIGKVSAAMFHHDTPQLFCRDLLQELLCHTGAQMGAVYLLNRQDNSFEHYESVGLSKDRLSSFSASEHEDVFQGALTAKQIQYLTAVPEDTRFVFTTIYGDLVPREIITIPVLKGEEVIAIISLATIKNFSSQALMLVERIWSEICARFNSVLDHQQTLQYSEKLQMINRELEAQAKELEIQAEELTEQNIELEMQKRQLDEASRLKSAFLSNMSHELRTPLNSVIALAGVLNRRLKGIIPEEEYSYLEIIERNGRNLLALINDILDLSRIEAGKTDIVLSRFSVRELVEDLVEMLRPLAGEKGISLYNHVAADLPLIESDSLKCKQILENLLSNAVKYTNQGKVEVSAAIRDDEINIAVADTGIGIAANQLEFIFDEFRQGDESTTRQNGGTGLGLAIAKRYAQMLGGSISVQSKPGCGSVFTLHLPMKFSSSDLGDANDSLRDNGKDNYDQELMPKCSGWRILLVEDSEPAIIQMQDILWEQGYQVEVARSGKEALDCLHKTGFDGIILDLMMPEMDGFEVLQAIRSAEKTKETPVLILTAKHICKEELNFLRGNHIFQLIQKGTTGKNELLAAVRNMISKSNKGSVSRESPLGKTGLYRSGKRPRVLVVEDNADNLTTIKALLQENYEVIEAVDGPQGLEQAGRHQPALILLDLALPKMDGFQVLRELKKDPMLRRIPVIALTARAFTEDREEILAYGFDGYLSKPIDSKLLEETIRRFADGEQKTQAPDHR